MIQIITNDDNQTVDVRYSQTVDAYDGQHRSGATYRTLREIVIARSDYEPQEPLTADEVEWWTETLTVIGDLTAAQAELSPDAYNALARAAGYEDAADLDQAMQDTSDLDVIASIARKVLAHRL